MSCIIILIGDTIVLFMKCMLSTNRSFIYIIQPPPHHNYVTLHAFSICATALGKRPPAPPSHSASYNITCNHHYHHHHHLDHHNTNYNACIQYMHHCFRKTTTTSASYCGLGLAPAPFRPPHVPRSTCAQW